MKQKIIGILLALLVLIGCTTMTATAFGESNEYDSNIKQIEYLENGFKLITEMGTLSNARSTIETQYLKEYITDSNNNEVCSFTIYGEFNSATRQCVNSYYTSWTSGGQWRVEDPKQWNDGYTVYGSAIFVRRVLGIKIDSRPVNPQLVY